MRLFTPTKKKAQRLLCFCVVWVRRFVRSGEFGEEYIYVYYRRDGIAYVKAFHGSVTQFGILSPPTKKKAQRLLCFCVVWVRRFELPAS